MPNTNMARVDDVMSTVKLADRTRPVVEEYFSTPAPKLLVVSASRTTAYWIANPTDIDGARKRALARCHEKSGAECTVVMENNRPRAAGGDRPAQDRTADTEARRDVHRASQWTARLDRGGRFRCGNEPAHAACSAERVLPPLALLLDGGFASGGGSTSGSGTGSPPYSWFTTKH